MTLTQLKMFLTAPELGHVTCAAKKLGLAQPAISAAIAAFENQNQVKLFNRGGRSIQVPEAGKMFVSEVRAGCVSST